MMSKLETLLAWKNILDNLGSLLNAIRLWRRGQSGGSLHSENVLPLQLRDSGLTIYCRPGTSDFLTFREIFERQAGEYSDFVEEVSFPVGRIVDVGTNVGHSIAYFLWQWPHAQIVGIEPSAENIEVTRRSFAHQISTRQVKVIQAFLGGQEGYAHILTGDCEAANEFRMTEPASQNERSMAVKVPVLTISAIIQTYELPLPIDVLKCDAEGAEYSIFQNCRRWINCVRYLIVELHDGLDDSWLLSVLEENQARFDILGVRCKGDTQLVWMSNSVEPKSSLS